MFFAGRDTWRDAACSKCYANAHVCGGGGGGGGGGGDDDEAGLNLLVSS